MKNDKYTRKYERKIMIEIFKKVSLKITNCSTSLSLVKLLENWFPFSLFTLTVCQKLSNGTKI